MFDCFVVFAVCCFQLVFLFVVVIVVVIAITVVTVVVVGSSGFISNFLAGQEIGNAFPMTS